MNLIFEEKEYGDQDYQKIVEQFLVSYSDKKRVAVIMNREPSLLFLLYYMFKNNITYIPIDPSYPEKRIQYILENASPDAIINTSKEYSEHTFDQFISKNPTYDKEISYILYTSGSTGNPKGVEVRQDALYNFIDWMDEVVDLKQDKRIGCFTTVSFDIFFIESLMALEKDITVVLANDNEQRNPKLMAELIEKSKIDIIQMTPSRMQFLLNYDKNLECLKNMKEILLGGEPLPLNLLKSLQEKTNAKIYNFYGPTEATVYCSASDMTTKNQIDIGKPMINSQIYIVDENLNIVKDGEIGEMCIAGKCLAKGYCANDTLTSEVFVTLPQFPEIRVYRSGDLGRYLPDGRLECLGRIDNQIKLRGHRIELQEIESAMSEFPGISQSLVRVININDENKILEALFEGTQDIDKDKLRDHLKEKLPEYMIPMKYTQIQGFLYTQNGKIDRKSMSHMEFKPINEMKSDSKLSEIEEKVLNVIKAMTNEEVNNNIFMDTEFAEVGIDSILFIKIIVALEGEFGTEFDDDILLMIRFSNIGEFVSYLESVLKEI